MRITARRLHDHPVDIVPAPARCAWPNGEVLFEDPTLQGGVVLRLLRYPRPLGVAGARNRGLEHARGEVVVFSDAHNDVPPGWWPPLVATLNRPGVGIVGPGIAVHATHRATDDGRESGGHVLLPGQHADRAAPGRFPPEPAEPPGRAWTKSETAISRVTTDGDRATRGVTARPRPSRRRSSYAVVPSTAAIRATPSRRSSSDAA